MKALNHNDAEMMINVLDYMTDATRQSWTNTVASVARHFDWTTSKMSGLLEKAARRNLVNLMSDPVHRVRFVTAAPAGRQMLAEWREALQDESPSAYEEDAPNPILEAALTDAEEMDDAAAALRLKGYGVQIWTEDRGQFWNLKVTAPYSKETFEESYGEKFEVAQVLRAMGFVAPPFYPDSDPTPAEGAEAMRRADHLAERTARREPSDALKVQAVSLAPSWNFLVLDENGELKDKGPTGRPLRFAFERRAYAETEARRSGSFVYDTMEDKVYRP